MRTSKPFIKNRNKLGASKPIFVPNLVAGNSLKDIISQTDSTTSISGARYGVVNGVVAQFGANKPRIEDKGFGACPAFTQLCKQSETLIDSSVWLLARMGTPILSGSFNGVNLWQLPEDTTSNTHTLPQAQIAGITDNSVFGIRCKAKYSGRHLELKAQRKDGTIVTICWVNLQTGAINSQLGGSFVSVTPLPDGVFDIFATISVLAGATNPRLYLQLHNGTTGIYLGDGASGVYLSQPTYINFGVGGTPFIPPYVPNNTTSSVSVVSEAATSTTGTSFDLDLATLSRLKAGLRGPNAQGHIELEFESNVDSRWFPSAVAASVNIFSMNNLSYTLRFRMANSQGSIRCEDSSEINSCADVTRDITPGQIFKIILNWGYHPSGGLKMRLTVDGVASNIVAFTGSFGTQDLRFFFGNAIHAGWIKNLKYYERPRW